MRNVVILGSTGSIGHSTLAVIREHPEQFHITALVASHSVEKMVQQCIEFNPTYAILTNPIAAKSLAQQLSSHGSQVEVLTGIQAIKEIVSLPEVDDVMSAIVGAAGLIPTLAAVQAGKRILLANKESLVMSGRLFMEAAAQSQAEILPIDSEHNAIYQSLPNELQQQLGFMPLADHGISTIILTGSGGPFRHLPLAEFANITPEQACAHPNWSMGPKISVDSATMMNKGLEYIEARYLFNAAPEQMEIIIHPESVIHSMVRYIDGSIIAQLGTPDMCTPIAHALAYPNRIKTPVKPLIFSQLSGLTFFEPDYQRYPCLQLAILASKAGQAATTIVNAANEVSVAAFLAKRVAFTDIAQINEAMLQQLDFVEPTSLEEILAIDEHTRQQTQKYIQTHKC